MAHFWDWLIAQDQNLFLAANHFLNQIPGLEYILGWPTFVAAPRNFILITVIFIFFWDRKEYWKTLAVVLFAFVITESLCHYVKEWIHRERPFEVFSSAITHFKLPSTKSFPSGHVAAVACVTVVLSHIYKNKFIWLYVAVFWIAITRIYVGVHYPLDVIGGFLVGLIGGGISLGLFHRLMIGLGHDKRK